MKLRLHFLLVLTCAATHLPAQSSYFNLIQQASYQEALDLANKQLKSYPQDSLALYMQGVCRLQLGEPEQALHSLTAAAERFRPLSFVHLQQVKCYAQLQQEKQALALLDSLVQNGFSSYYLLQDSLLTPLHQLPAFQAAKDSIYKRAFPCFAEAKYRHFDFWIGEWEVFANNRKVGDNVISRQEGGCMLLEQYTTARDYVGQSTNFYDPNDDKWKQIWIDNTGSVSKYVETARKPGYLQLITDTSSTPAQPTLRMTFTQQEDGSVRQFIEQSSDNGLNWQVAFDGTYRRKNSSHK